MLVDVWVPISQFRCLISICLIGLSILHNAHCFSPVSFQSIFPNSIGFVDELERKVGIFKFGWNLCLVLFLVLSLSLNIALFVGGSLSKMASSAFGSLTGMRTVAVQHADEVAELSSNLVNERRLNRELEGEVADITDNLVSERKVAAELKEEVADLTGDLAADRAARRKLSGEIAELSGDLAAERIASKKIRNQLPEITSDLVAYRGRKMAVSEAVDLTADGISNRAVRSSSRSISSMAGEAIPYVGVAVIAGVTALDLKDLCDTIKDMNELKRAFNPELQPSEDETTVCSVIVPTKEELWETAKASPSKAWAAAREATPTLEDLREYEFPDIDWTGAWSITVDGAGNTWAATLDVAGSALDATTTTASGWIGGATKYWSGSDDTEQTD